MVACGSTLGFACPFNARRVAKKNRQPRESGLRDHLRELVAEGGPVVRHLAVSETIP